MEEPENSCSSSDNISFPHHNCRWPSRTGFGSFSAAFQVQIVIMAANTSFATSRVGALNGALGLSVATGASTPSALSPFTPYSANSSAFISDAPSQSSVGSSIFISDASSMPAPHSSGSLFDFAASLVESYILPYATPSIASPIHGTRTRYASSTAKALLANSGVGTWTDYALSDSPRQPVRTCNQQLDYLATLYDGRAQKSKAVGCVLRSVKWVVQDEIDTSVGFQPFSYTAAKQTRMHMAALIDALPLSPGSKSDLHGMSVAELCVLD